MQQRHRQFTMFTNYGLYQDHHQCSHYLECKTILESAWSGRRAAPSSNLNERLCGESFMDDIFLSTIQFFTYNVTDFHRIDVRRILHTEWYAFPKTKYCHPPIQSVKVFPLQARSWPGELVEIYIYSFMTAALEEGEWSASRPQPPFTPRERPGTHCTGSWVGPRAGLDRCGKYHPHRDSIPGPSSP